MAKALTARPGPGFDSQLPHSGLQRLLPHIPRDLIPSSDLRGKEFFTRGGCAKPLPYPNPAYRQNMHTYEMSFEKKKIPSWADWFTPII